MTEEVYPRAGPRQAEMRQEAVYRVARIREEAGFPGKVPPCGTSSGGGWLRGWAWVVDGGVADHGLQGEDAAAGQGEECLVVTFSLVPFEQVAADEVGSRGGKI